ncbi:MAG: putative cytoplasmic rane protein LemA [Chitinophagaceae bacterium]|nr:putative cytoplasmic rane protein LemA [Chitinophagaceae bacterium]
MPVLIIPAILVVIAIWLMNAYNKLASLRKQRQNAFAEIDVQLCQRHDLVPQLVETVKGYAGYEKELLLKITEARSGAVSATTIDDKIRAEQQLTKTLQGLTVQVEAYPDLKANPNFLRLKEELGDIEIKLAASRHFFNAATTEYNNSTNSFPFNLIANNFDFKREMLFDPGMEGRKELEATPAVK